MIKKKKQTRKATVISNQQFGVMPGKSISDAVFALMQCMEKYEKGRDLTLVFTHLEKLYDRSAERKDMEMYEEKRYT